MLSFSRSMPPRWTVLHAAMLLQASGHANALRALIGAEQDRGPRVSAARQRAFRPVSARQPGKAAPRRNAAGGTTVTA